MSTQGEMPPDTPLLLFWALYLACATDDSASECLPGDVGCAAVPAMIHSSSVVDPDPDRPDPVLY